MKSIEVTAKTMEDAVAQGLVKLGVSANDVTIEIIEAGQKGFLGFLGGKPFVVRLSVNEVPDTTKHDVLKSVGLGKKTTENKAVAPKTNEPEKTQRKAKPVAQRAKPQKPQKPHTPREPRFVTTPATPEGLQKAIDFLKELTTKMNVTVEVTGRINEEGNICIDMQGDTQGVLIGRRGETLDALQYLTSIVVNRGQEGYSRITLDTENYRAKREEALKRLANRMASRALKTGRKVVMEPMNPYERRILHSVLQQNDAVVTHSEGEEPNRHVVITLK